MGAFFELMIANVRLDHAPRIAVTTTVTGKTIFKGKNGRSPPEYWRWILTVEPWQGLSDDPPLRVSPAVWEQVAPGQRIRFHPHPGSLGWVWYTPEELAEDGFVVLLR